MTYSKRKSCTSLAIALLKFLEEKPASRAIACDKAVHWYYAENSPLRSLSPLLT
ncbi:MAG: hypothetical protein RM347_034890 [Nostoc sp. ChiQUE02]|uniref:hypothetical protein n=1 Tax=Nostoc sp. ChiQUE02 TaxID=3075377 RepID=UPI002AD451F2|nr:hypothetical protein [Nostoc sp. ChiQUE02]MDZ8228879.1 hypothetical protein [Nostoc sp. ChiQUE02]